MLLEPVMEVEVVTPQEFMGDVIGDLNSRRGKILNMENRAGAQVIEARVPLATMFGYATELRSMTQGRATYTMQFAAYEPVPQQIYAELMERSGDDDERHSRLTESSQEGHTGGKSWARLNSNVPSRTQTSARSDISTTARPR